MKKVSNEILYGLSEMSELFRCETAPYTRRLPSRFAMVQVHSYKRILLSCEVRPHQMDMLWKKQQNKKYLKVVVKLIK